MKSHKGVTLLELMVVIVLSSIPLAIISQYTGIVTELAVDEGAYVVSQREISATVYYLQHDVKSADSMEVSTTTLSLVSDTGFVKYTWADDTLYRTDDSDTEVMISSISGSFSSAMDGVATMTYVLNGDEKSVTIYGEVMG